MNSSRPFPFIPVPSYNPEKATYSFVKIVKQDFDSEMSRWNSSEPFQFRLFSRSFEHRDRGHVNLQNVEARTHKFRGKFLLSVCVRVCKAQTSSVVCSSRIYECGVWFPWPLGIQIRSRSFLISRSFMRFARSYRVHCHVVGRVTSEAKRDVSAFGIESPL